MRVPAIGFLVVAVTLIAGAVPAVWSWLPSGSSASSGDCPKPSPAH
jgi:hypothetical protein